MTVIHFFLMNLAVLMLAINYSLDAIFEITIMKFLKIYISTMYEHLNRKHQQGQLFISNKSTEITQKLFF